VPASTVTVVSAETAPGQDSAPADAVRVPRSRLPADAIDDAEIEATLAEHRRWVAAGRPGAVSHAEAMAELLRGGQ
jgi:hypothetical protein